MGALENEWWPLVVLIVASSLLAVVYIWKVVEVTYLEKGPETLKTSEAPIEMLVPLWILVVLNFYFGIETDLTISVARNVAEVFMGVAP